ncbi:zinc finger protein 723-like isoform X4 [Anguilla rostrata]|uniref:zinc finger protein 723-like isoform X4 n=1 Tax=Anguilla rostrata TaxID=7938 RepID=UPI0030D53BF5
MMQTGVCLRQDTETTLPELTEQHRIRQKEEELSGLEPVHMAESETECAAPGLNTLEPECVTAHSGVSDVHHTHTSLKTETHLDSPQTGDFIKTENLDSAELGCISHLHSDQTKTESVDGGYVKVEHISELQDIKYVNFKSEKIKSECLMSDVMNTVMNGGAVGEPNQNCKNEEMTQCGVLDHNCDINNENTQPRIVLQKSINSRKKNIDRKKTGHRNQRKINMSEKRYRCTQCEKCFSQKSALSRHKRIHTGEKPYRYKRCEKCFSLKGLLTCHKRIHSGEKPFKCAQCEMCFSQKSTLNSHKRIHTGEKPYKCTECEKCFSQTSTLYSHKRIHTGEKPYKCTECGKCFSRNSVLNDHKTIHSGQKLYTCSECGKCFSQKSSLNRHKMIHTGEKPYKCPQCGKCFLQKSNLNSHRIIHSDEKTCN